MVTDGWEEIRARFARLIGRHGSAETAAATRQLEQSRQALAELTGAELEQARKEQEIVWRTRLGDFLERYPQSRSELLSVVGEAQAIVAAAQGSTVSQHVTAADHARQAVLGHGVQVNNFGDNT